MSTKVAKKQIDISLINTFPSPLLIIPEREPRQGVVDRPNIGIVILGRGEKRKYQLTFLPARCWVYWEEFTRKDSPCHITDVMNKLMAELVTGMAKFKAEDISRLLSGEVTRIMPSAPMIPEEEREKAKSSVYCAHCGFPIKYIKTLSTWLHAYITWGSKNPQSPRYNDKVYCRPERDTKAWPEEVEDGQGSV